MKNISNLICLVLLMVNAAIFPIFMNCQIIPNDTEFRLGVLNAACAKWIFYFIHLAHFNCCKNTLKNCCKNTLKIHLKCCKNTLTFCPTILLGVGHPPSVEKVKLYIYTQFK